MERLLEFQLVLIVCNSRLRAVGQGGRGSRVVISVHSIVLCITVGIRRTKIMSTIIMVIFGVIEMVGKNER